MNPARGANEAFAATLVDELARLGVRHAVVCPGSRSGPLALAFERDDRIRVHVHLDERSAAFFALGIAKATGVPAPVVCTSGTAAANLFPAVVEARHALVPLLALTADRPPELRATGANQTIDQLKMFGDAVVWFADSGTPETFAAAPGYWRSLAGRAFSEATNAPGPVHLNLPLREPLYPGEGTEPYPFPTEGREGQRPWTRVSPPSSSVTEDLVSDVAPLLAETERGLIVAGWSGDDLLPLLDLAAALGWPLLAEPASNLRVPGTISTYDALLRADGFARAHRPDLVVRVGKLALGRPLAALLKTTRQIALDPHRAWFDEHRSVERMIGGDIRSVCDSLVNALGTRPGGDWKAAWDDADHRARTAIDATIDGFDTPSEPRAARDLAASLPDGSNLFAASSMPVRDLESFMHPREGVRVYANRGTNGIDGCVSTTLGVAAATGAPTFALLGDLALLHDANGFLTEAHDATFVVLNNDGGGIFSFLEQADVDGFERVFGTPHGRDPAALAGLHGLGHSLVDAPDGLPDALRSGARVIEVRTDRNANVEHHRALWAAVERSL